MALCVGIGIALSGCSGNLDGVSEGRQAAAANLDETAQAPQAAPAKFRLEPDLPYRARRSNPVTHDVDFSVVVTPPYRCQVLKVWLPLPQSDFGQEVSESQLSTFPVHVTPQVDTEPIYGNRFAYFEFHKPEGAQIIRNRFQAKVWDLHFDVEAEKVTAVEKWPQSFAAYLRPQAISRQKDFDDLLRQVVPRPTTPAADLFSVMDWVDANIKYDHANASLRADAEHAFSNLCGHCSDYHGLCATMGRSLGYPARVTYGLALFPKNSPSHCKLEAFLPPYGWVSFDVSETQKLIQSIREDKTLSDEEKRRLTGRARHRLKRGFRENSWLLITKGTDYDLVPRASRKAPLVRTIYAEADGEPLPDPDPANSKKREFGWMTVHDYKADREFALPFQDFSTLSNVQ
jgi:transglutaminase-like putative cysteine protease